MTPQRIFANLNRHEFVGRDSELEQIGVRTSPSVEPRGLLLLAAPEVGASELLRQAYDQAFWRRSEAIPLYFAFRRGESIADSARRLFHSFLQQFIAYRRIDPVLCSAPATLAELGDLAMPADYDLVTLLTENFERERATGTELDLLRFSLSTPRRFISAGHHLLPLFDCFSLSWLSQEESAIGCEIANTLWRPKLPFVLAGLRRRLNDLVQDGHGGREVPAILRIERLEDTEAQRVFESHAGRMGIESNEPTRDLIVQQLNASPLFISNLIDAAYEMKTPLTSFLDCQRLYVDELMGGKLHRHFAGILDQVTANPQTRKTLLRILYESAARGMQRPSFLVWKKRLGVESGEFERMIDLLHIHELVNSTGAFIEVNQESTVWMDYLATRYRLEVLAEERALVVPATLMETLKRAPQTMAQKYRREAALGLGDLLEHFNCQRLPASLFHYDRFAAEHKGTDPDAIDRALDNESELLRLPQVVHVTACATLRGFAPRTDNCVVAHGFEAGEYSDENETVWIAAQFESKLAASRELALEWFDRLSALAREYKFPHARLWLISPEGFSAEASELLRERQAYCSSRQQIELLSARLKTSEKPKAATMRPDEFEMVIPMGNDTELIAAHTVEQVARRVNFRPEAINQIKTALVEACINAAEHSLSPDRKIYQRFRIEGDKLIVTVASRGVVPANLADRNGDVVEQEKPDAKSRRGWGLKLIKTLMDEVEFERVDDGTQIRMIKYLR